MLLVAASCLLECSVLFFMESVVMFEFMLFGAQMFKEGCYTGKELAV
jgi:hypothetical protein